jgi:hypothetical protein
MRDGMRTLAIAALLTSLAAWAPQDDAGFVPLFNGRDLDGWVSVNCAPTTWTVRDGVIHSSGKPICELRTARMYENFVLELEYQHLDAQGNAGVFIWGDALTAPGQPFVRAIEVQILDGRNTENYTSHGDVFAIHGATMTPDRPHPAGWMRSLPSERRARPAGEWNHYRITAQNGTIRLAVNGADVSGGRDITPRKGYIHLESEGGRVLYRNVRLKELPSAGTLASDQVARADEGFVSLYNGVDFAGWQHTAGHQGRWAAKDWVIAYDGGGERDAKILRTERTFGDAAVIVDWRWTNTREPKTVPIWLDGLAQSDETRATIARALAAMPAPPSSGWRRGTLTRSGGRLSLLVDQQTVLDNVPIGPAAPRHRLVLQPEEGAAEFASVFVKDLSSSRPPRP